MKFDYFKADFEIRWVLEKSYGTVQAGKTEIAENNRNKNL